MKIFNDGTAEQISSATHECKKNDFYVKIFRRRRRNDGVENGLKGLHVLHKNHATTRQMIQLGIRFTTDTHVS